MTVPWLLTCIIIIYIDITNDKNLAWTVCNAAAGFFPIIFVTILWNRTPKIDDEFRIIKEARYFTWMAITAIFLYLLVGFTPALGATRFTRYILGNISGVIDLSTATLWYLCYPLYVARVHEREQCPNGLQSAHVKNLSAQSYHTTLVKILSKEASISAYMEHLKNEWSMELLLSFIEFTQFKHVIIQMFRNEIDEEILDKYHRSEQRQQAILKNPCIPYSSIVHSGLKKIDKLVDYVGIKIQAKSYSEGGKDYENSSADIVDAENSASSYDQKSCKDYHDKAWSLCKKYVENGGEFQINLPHHRRTAIMKSMNHYFYNNKQMNMNELFCLFDDAMDELWKFMIYSFCRFILTEKFKSLNLE